MQKLKRKLERHIYTRLSDGTITCNSMYVQIVDITKIHDYMSDHYSATLQLDTATITIEFIWTNSKLILFTQQDENFVIADLENS